VGLSRTWTVTRIGALVVSAVTVIGLSLTTVGRGAERGPQLTPDRSRILEIRVYTLKKGTREAFHQRFLRESLPMLRRRAVDVVAYGPSLHDADSYYLARSFASLDDRTRSEDAFYGSSEWINGPRDAVLAAIETYSTVVVRADDQALEALRRLVQ
jgi:NIPSNAP